MSQVGREGLFGFDTPFDDLVFVILILVSFATKGSPGVITHHIVVWSSTVQLLQRSFRSLYVALSLIHI